jgi:hypothetical protein
MSHRGCGKTRDRGCSVGNLAGCRSPDFALTVQKASNRLKGVKAKQKRATVPVSSRQEIRHVRTAEGQAPARSPREARKLLVRAFSHPEGSSERRQAFSEYLNALHDEHAK